MDPVPLKKMLALGSRFVFEDWPVTTRLVAGVSKSPTVNASGPAEALVSIVWLATALMVGGWFAGTPTVSRKLVLTMAPPPSVTVSETVAVPL